MFLLSFVAFILIFINNSNCKYVEGTLKTFQNWAFLARFCFLSEEGEFEYEIEYNSYQGVPNLLLYYDTDDQWPAVYKSSKTCEQREDVLNIGQNQIVNLTVDYVYRDLSGCVYLEDKPSTLKPTVSTTTKGTIKMSSAFQFHPSVTTMSSTDQVTTEHYSTEPIITTSSDFAMVDNNTDYITEESWDVISSEASTISLINETSTETIAEDIATTETHLLSKRSVARRPKMLWNAKSQRMVFCHNARRFRSSRERWWFIAVSNCNGTKGIDIKYRLLMTNGPPEDYWHAQFSADEFYILPVLMAFSIAYSLLMLGIVMCSIELRSRQLLHSTYKIYVLSVVLQLAGILVVCTCYLKLAVSGLMAFKVRRFGLILMGASETTFLLLVLLLAKGYTITRGRLPLAASIKLVIFLCVYVVTYLSLFIYEAEVFDPGEVLYLYESPAGYGLIVLRVTGWCMFVYSTIFTLKHYPEKSNFYYPFNIFGTVWFVAGPAFILSANSYIDKWVRESIVCAVLLFISFGGHLMFLMLTMPSVANKNFPYHVRTTQIGIMNTTGSDNMEPFGHHVYEPTTTLREQTVIIPLTKTTEELFEGIYNKKMKNYPNIRVDEEPGVDAPDRTLENVLNWSRTSNIPNFDLANFERRNPTSSAGSSNSRMTDNSNTMNILSRRPSYNQVQKTQNRFDDYVKDVPVALFTVSKMVVTNDKLHNNTQDQ